LLAALTWISDKVRSLTRNQTILFLLGVASVLIGVIGLYPLVAHKVRVDGNTGLGPPEPNLAVFMRCDMIALPITIPAHTTIHLVPVNPRRLKATGWGSYDIPNDADKPEQWPDKHRIDESNKKHNSGVFNYKCDVSNHGQVNVIDIAMPMRFWFGNKAGEENAVPYTPIISPLDAGHTFTLYFVNDCSIMASAALPNLVTLTIVGETKRRSTKLHRPGRNPIEQIMTCFPTSVRWIGGELCE